MNIKRILFPTDFSDNSEAARQTAASLARASGADLLVVHVQEPPPHVADRGFSGYAEQLNEEDARQQLHETATADPRVSCEERLLAGEPADTIVRCADDEQADLIVIGSHGRTGLARLLLGSVAEAVVRRARCPVLTVKTG